MNNIYSNEGFAGISLHNGVGFSQSQYDLFFQNGTLQAPAGVQTGDVAGLNSSTWNNSPLNNQQFLNMPVFGDPSFVDPLHGNFNLGPASSAIDAGRSELGPSFFGDFVYPAVNQVLNATGGVLNYVGHSNSEGLEGGVPSPLDYVFLPGSSLTNYVTSWVPVLPTSPYAIPGPSTMPGTWDYASLTAIANGSSGTIVVPAGGGERDQNGVQRSVDPNNPHGAPTGGGSKPYFDIGAYEYIQYFPPDVTGVSATFNDPTLGATTKNIYAVGSVAGTNVAHPVNPGEVQPRDRPDDDQLDDRRARWRRATGRSATPRTAAGRS